jgi:hypothetical protein
MEQENGTREWNKRMEQENGIRECVSVLSGKE